MFFNNFTVVLPSIFFYLIHIFQHRDRFNKRLHRQNKAAFDKIIIFHSKLSFKKLASLFRRNKTDDLAFSRNRRHEIFFKSLLGNLVSILEHIDRPGINTSFLAVKNDYSDLDVFTMRLFVYRVRFKYLDHFVMAKVTIFNANLTLDQPFHFSSNKVEPSDHRDQY